MYPEIHHKREVIEPELGITSGVHLVRYHSEDRGLWCGGCNRRNETWECLEPFAKRYTGGARLCLYIDAMIPPFGQEAERTRGGEPER